MTVNPARILIIFLSLLFYGCGSAQIPPEVQMGDDQARNLWRAGVSEYLPVEYNKYTADLKTAKDDIAKEADRFVLFRDYKPYIQRFKDILVLGNEILVKVEIEKAKKADSLSEQISSFKTIISNLQKFTLKINEGRLARADLMKADLLLNEVELRYKKGEYAAAEAKIDDLSMYLKSAEDSLSPIIGRYSDRSQVEKWQKWAEDTVAESREKGIIVIVVNKSKRTLSIYRDGELMKKYSVGIGRNGSFDKIHAGDNATPEGKYKITKKLPASRYYKALLINYPSDQDRKQFIQAKKKGLVPNKAGIGGLIEIHGGGSDTMTFGCISMENRQMDEIYNMVKVGTPVTIVGAVHLENSISSALGGK